MESDRKPEEAEKEEREEGRKDGRKEGLTMNDATAMQPKR